MNLQPLGDRVVVKPLSEEDSKTPSGIYIPDTAKEKPQEGEVVAVGPGEPNDNGEKIKPCLLYTSPSPRDKRQSRMPSSA